MNFNENSRVKIPAILHLCRLGYEYQPLTAAIRDESTNIFTDLFSESIRRLFERQDILELENQHLSSLRDWLLPMLMNGQVKVG
jgi:hypothetical protein